MPYHRFLRRFLPLASVLALGLGCAASAPLRYTTSWLGNSFGGGPHWVQNFVEGLHVLPDGTVIAASVWDEGGREYGLYRDGKAVGKADDTHGWGARGGYAAASNDRYLFLAMMQDSEKGHLKGKDYPPRERVWYGVSRRTLDGAHAPFEGGHGRFGDLLVLHDIPENHRARVRGLAADAKGRVFVSDDLAGEIRVLDGATMRTLDRWPCPRPRALAVDKSGAVWAIQQGANRAEGYRVTRFSSDGAPLGVALRFPAAAVPTGLCFDTEGRLLVADNGPDQQVHVFENPGTSPRLAGALGEKGGLYAGRRRGRTGPKRFTGLNGVGVDRDGNVYVGGNQPAGGAVLRSFTPDGALRWELLGLEFVDIADVDPESDGEDVFTTENRYTMDWSRKEPGRQWTWRGQTIDPFRYPNDPRLHEENHDFSGVLFRRIRGRRFLVMRGMFQHMLAFYQLKGEIAVPSVLFSKGPYRGGGWSPPGQPERGRWMWRDVNGDGDFQKDEYFDTAPERDPESWAWWVDTAGGVWQGHQTGEKPIRYFPLQGFDAKGNPIYSREESRTFALPAPMNHLLRLEYHPETDTMYLSGHTKERPKAGDEWGQAGSELWRIDDWMTGKRTPRWRIALPYEPEVGASAPGVSVSKTTIKAFSTAGDALFAVESRTALVHVYDTRTGKKLGEMKPGREVGGESGWVDFPDAIRAFRRDDGEYVVFVEEDGKGKIIIYRWAGPKAS